MTAGGLLKRSFLDEYLLNGLRSKPMKRLWFILITLLILQLADAPTFARGPQETKLSEVTLTELPKEGRETVLLIKRGGPFPYKRDGAVFGNFERRLPVKERGYYREYTVPTPGSHDRGARRIIAGRGGEYYYTDDHYQTFHAIRQ
jgi:ribonuclease T1